MTWIRAHAAEASANPLALLRAAAGALLLAAPVTAHLLAVAGLGWQLRWPIDACPQARHQRRPGRRLADLGESHVGEMADGNRR